MSESFPLPTEPEGVIPSLVERFNSGKVEVMMALYAPEAVFIANDGRTIMVGTVALGVTLCACPIPNASRLAPQAR